MNKHTIIIIGGGASGLMSAIISARSGLKVTLLERMNRVGKKILATGNGRCNYSNINASIESYRGNNINFCKSVLDNFSVEKTLEFFNTLGIEPRIERGGYVYPFSNQASSILDVLRYEVERLNINVYCSTNVKKIIKKQNQFTVITDDNNFYAEKIILCCGGKSSSNLGSNGSGFELARQLGHKIILPVPALVQLRATQPFLKQLKGVRINGSTTLIYKDRSIKNTVGEILFTDYGLSGIPILQLSRYASKLLSEKKQPYIILDMMNNYNNDQLNKLLIKRFLNMSYKSLGDSFIGLINKKLISIIIKLAGCSFDQPVSTITKKQRNNLVKVFKSMIFDISGTNQWNQSQVTAGGVSTAEVNPQTMASKICKNLYFAGEILDIDGDCGGYNLQWAWSSAYLAGLNASKNSDWQN